MIVNTHEVIAKSERARYKCLSIISEITHIQIFMKIQYLEISFECIVSTILDLKKLNN